MFRENIQTALKPVHLVSVEACEAREFILLPKNAMLSYSHALDREPIDIFNSNV